MKNFLLLSIVLFFVACAEKLDNNLLLGNWQLEEWVEQKTNRAIDGTMTFSFGDDNRYRVDYGSTKETGKYWISGSYLHTVEDGQAEKKVLITQLSADSLSFEMNRAGSIEEVLLLKK